MTQKFIKGVRTVIGGLKAHSGGTINNVLMTIGFLMRQASKIMQQIPSSLMTSILHEGWFYIEEKKIIVISQLLCHVSSVRISGAQHTFFSHGFTLLHTTDRVPLLDI